LLKVIAKFVEAAPGTPRSRVRARIRGMANRDRLSGLDAAFTEKVTATNCKRLYGFA
jgi:hypothetical protein